MRNKLELASRIANHNSNKNYLHITLVAKIFISCLNVCAAYQQNVTSKKHKRGYTYLLSRICLMNLSSTTIGLPYLASKASCMRSWLVYHENVSLFCFSSIFSTIGLPQWFRDKLENKTSRHSSLLSTQSQSTKVNYVISYHKMVEESASTHQTCCHYFFLLST